MKRASIRRLDLQYDDKFNFIVTFFDTTNVLTESKNGSDWFGRNKGVTLMSITSVMFSRSALDGFNRRLRSRANPSQDPLGLVSSVVSHVDKDFCRFCNSLAKKKVFTKFQKPISDRNQ